VAFCGKVLEFAVVGQIFVKFANPAVVVKKTALIIFFVTSSFSLQNYVF